MFLCSTQGRTGCSSRIGAALCHISTCAVDTLHTPVPAVAWKKACLLLMVTSELQVVLFNFRPDCIDGQTAQDDCSTAEDE